MHDPRHARLRQRVVFDQPVQKGRVAPVAHAVDVPAGLGRVVGVEGRQFGRVLFSGGEDGADGAGFGGGGDAGAADVGESEARQGCFARGAFAVDVVSSARGGAFHVVVVEAFQNVEVRVGGDVGDDVDFARFGFGGLLPGVDGVEGEGWIRFVYADEALTVPSVDYEPEILFVRVEFHGVQHVSRPQDLETAFGVVGVEDAENHVPFRQEY